MKKVVLLVNEYDTLYDAETILRLIEKDAREDETFCLEDMNTGQVITRRELLQAIDTLSIIHKASEVVA